MQNVIEQIEQQQIGNKKITPFSIGDTVTVKVKIKEGDRERLQAYTGVVIAKKNRGINSSFTVRKVSHSEGVERVFQTYSPQISSIKLERRGDVRKAKLYHLRELSGRKARIREKIVTKDAKEKAASGVAVGDKGEASEGTGAAGGAE